MNHFYCCSFIAFFFAVNSFGQCFPEKPSVEIRDTTRIRMWCGAPIISVKPLYIIDGVMAEEVDLKNIDPNDIESIEILKDAAAVTLYCDRSQGVVIITTKIKGIIRIKDAVSGDPIAAATVDLIYGENDRHLIRFLADSLGQVRINDGKRGTKYKLRVSNMGYKPYSASFDAKTVKAGYTVPLQRNYANLKEVVVISWPVITCRNQTYSSSKVACDCLDEIKTIRKTIIGLTNAQGVERGIKFFPNPVLRSKQVSVEFENAKQGKIRLRLSSLDGRSIETKEYEAIKGVNNISYSINAHLSKGIYALQLIDENYNLIKAEKLIIQ